MSVAIAIYRAAQDLRPHASPSTGWTSRSRTGEVHGFLGPNGAGKSTTIRVLLGLLRADAGAVRLLGGDPWRDAAPLHRRLAYVPGDVDLWPNLTGGEVIDLLGRLRGGVDPRRRADLLERFDLDPTKKAPQLLQGQPAEGRAGRRAGLRRRAAAARRADLGPRPADGGGVPRSACARRPRAGRTVLLSSHILAEVEALCDRVSIIRAGRIVQHGTLAELRHLTRTTVVAETHAQPADRWTPYRGWRTSSGSTAGCSFDVDTDHLDEAMSYLASLRSGRWSATRRPWRSCSCGSTATPSRRRPAR